MSLTFTCTDWGKQCLAAAVTDSITFTSVKYSTDNSSIYSASSTGMSNVVVTTGTPSVGRSNDIVNISVVVTNVTPTISSGSTAEIRSVGLFASCNNVTQLFAYSAVASSATAYYTWANTPISFSTQINLTMTTSETGTFSVTTDPPINSAATTSAPGIVRMATDAQAAAGTTAAGGYPLVCNPSQISDLVPLTTYTVTYPLSSFTAGTGSYTASLLSSASRLIAAPAITSINVTFQSGGSTQTIVCSKSAGYESWSNDETAYEVHYNVGGSGNFVIYITNGNTLDSAVTITYTAAGSPTTLRHSYGSAGAIISSGTLTKAFGNSLMYVGYVDTSTSGTLKFRVVIDCKNLATAKAAVTAWFTPDDTIGILGNSDTSIAFHAIDMGNYYFDVSFNTTSTTGTLRVGVDTNEWVSA